MEVLRHDTKTFEGKEETRAKGDEEAGQAEEEIERTKAQDLGVTFSFADHNP